MKPHKRLIYSNRTVRYKNSFKYQKHVVASSTLAGKWYKTEQDLHGSILLYTIIKFLKIRMDLQYLSLMDLCMQMNA